MYLVGATPTKLQAGGITQWGHSQFSLLFVVQYHFGLDGIGGIMVSMPPSSEVDHGFNPRLGQIKDYEIGICCFSTEPAPLRRKSKDWLAGNQDNVSEWGHIPIRGLLFQSASTRPTKRVGPVQSRHCWVDVKQRSLTHSNLDNV